MVGFQQLLRQPLGLFAEHQKGAVWVLHIAVGDLRLGGEVKEFCLGVLFKEFLLAVVVGNVQLVPVIQPGALDLLVRNGKAHGPYQVQPCAGGSAGAGDIAGVLGNFRFDERNVKPVFHLHDKEPSDFSPGSMPLSFLQASRLPLHYLPS